MAITGHGAVRKLLERPVLVGFDGKVRRPCVGGATRRHIWRRFRAAPGLADLRDTGRVPFSAVTLPNSRRLVDAARCALDRPCHGHLGELFLESNTLSLVTEVADRATPASARLVSHRRAAMLHCIKIAKAGRTRRSREIVTGRTNYVVGNFWR